MIKKDQKEVLKNYYTNDCVVVCGRSMLINPFFHTRTFKVLLTFALSWVYAVSSNVMVNLPFGLVPITLQTLACNLLALLFGWTAVNAYFLYLLQGVMGAPFFSNGGCGLFHLLGPTGGYLIGFLFSMMLLAFLKEKFSVSCLFIFTKLVLAKFILFSFGLLQLSLFVGREKVFYVGLYPFIIGDLLKMIITTFIAALFFKNVKNKKKLNFIW